MFWRWVLLGFVFQIFVFAWLAPAPVFIVGLEVPRPLPDIVDPNVMVLRLSHGTSTSGALDLRGSIRPW